MRNELAGAYRHAFMGAGVFALKQLEITCTTRMQRSSMVQKHGRALHPAGRRGYFVASDALGESEPLQPFHSHPRKQPFPKYSELNLPKDMNR